MSSANPPTQTASARALTYASYASFVPIGIATVLLGPMRPILSARWSLSYSQSGALSIAQYIASTCAVALSGVLAARWGFRFAMKAGLPLMAAGLALLLTGSKILGILCIAAYGAGLGVAVPAANLLVAAVNPERRSATLNLLNFFWSVGAVACPALVAMAARNDRIPLFLAVVSGFSIVVTIGIALMGRHIVEPRTAADAGPLLPFIRAKMNTFLAFAALFFLYVGVENGFGQWLASYAKSLGSLSLAMSLAAPSFFYASLMLGRWLAPLVLHALNEVRLVQFGLVMACAGMAGLRLSTELIGVATSACAAGLGLSIVYPITISLLSRDFGSPRIGSVMFVLSNIGGGLLPWFVGVSADQFNSLKAGLLVPLAGCILMLLFFLRDWTPTSAHTAQIPQAPLSGEL